MVVCSLVKAHNQKPQKQWFSGGRCIRISWKQNNHHTKLKVSRIPDWQQHILPQHAFFFFLRNLPPPPPYNPKAVVFNSSPPHPKDIWQCLKTFLVVMSWHWIRGTGRFWHIDNRGKDATKYPTISRTALHSKELSGPKYQHYWRWKILPHSKKLNAGKIEGFLLGH